MKSHPKLLPLILLLVGLFAVAGPVAGQLPESKGAPKVGEKAPDFTLPDTSGRPVKLSEVIAGKAEGRRPNAVLLIFYRGYW